MNRKPASKPINPRSPWRAGPHCDTPNAGRSYTRYRNNRPQPQGRGQA